MLICMGHHEGGRCRNNATCLVVSENIGEPSTRMPACDGCAAIVRECDGVTIEPLPGGVAAL